MCGPVRRRPFPREPREHIMPVHKYRPVKPYRHRTTHRPRLVFYLDDETLEEIDAEARRHDASVSSTIAMLVEVGLETLKIERAVDQG